MEVPGPLRPSAPSLSLPNHSVSHDGLLTVETDHGISAVDAIVVPIARPAARLRTAIDLAVALNCTLIAFCSRAASAADLVREYGGRPVDLVAIDLADVPPDLLPQFKTATLLAAERFEYTRDTSVKRNIGLLLAAAVGWERMLFLDDDITVPETTDLGRAAALLDQHDAVGLQIHEFPDNSVVCHANRDSQEPQGTFIGTGALMVGRSSVTSFFPRVYNEDWFFLLDPDGLRSAARIGSARQEDYDPYQDPERARLEEFGDTLAEGLFLLLDNHYGIHDATEDYWAAALTRRRGFIEEILGRLDRGVPVRADRDRMRAALTAALEVNGRISASLCTRYLAAWVDDRDLWRVQVDKFRHLYDTRPDWATLSGAEKLAEVIAEHGLTGAKPSDE